MIVGFRPDATAADRERVLGALDDLEIDVHEVEGMIVLGRPLREEEALRVAALPGVESLTASDAGTVTLRESLLRWSAAAALVLGLLVLAASHHAVGLGPPADPLRTPPDLSPAWPLLAWTALVDRAPAGFPVPLLVLLSCLLLLAWPFAARRLAERSPRLHGALGALALLAGLSLALLGLRP